MQNEKMEIELRPALFGIHAQHEVVSFDRGGFLAESERILVIGLGEHATGIRNGFFL